MQESGNRQFILKKVYEVSYAIFRIGSKVVNEPFKESIERQALALLDSAIGEDYSRLAIASRGLEYFIKFGNDVGFVHSANAEVIVAELDIINREIAGFDNPAMVPAIPLDDIFSGKEAEPEPLFPEPAKTDEASIMKSGIRQSAILEKIRQSGNCRLRDMQDIFPGTSVRTLRYDFQSLAERNLIEKVGRGGPAVFYRARQAVR